MNEPAATKNSLLHNGISVESSSVSTEAPDPGFGAPNGNLLRTLIDHLQEYIFIKDKESRHMLDNSANLRLLGLPPDGAIGKTVFDLFPPPLAQRYFEDDRKVFELGKPLIDREEPIQDRNGHSRWLLTTKVPFHDADGNVAGLIGISRDITERKQAESEIQKLAAFPRLNPNPVLEINREGTLTYYNQAAIDMARGLGRSHPAEMLPAEAGEIVKECLRVGKPKTSLETEQAKRIISWSFFPAQASDTVHCYAMDITDRKQMEAQLLQAQKMESIGQLAGGVAHDFNNILTVIQGHAAVLAAGAKPNSDEAESLRQIMAAAERAANLTRQLLTFSRQERMRPKVMDLNEAVGSISQLLRRILGEDIALEMRYGPAVPMVKADPGMIEQVVMNLAVNARDAMPKGGELRISTGTARFEPGENPGNPEARAGLFAMLVVEDTGEGIAPDILPRIFEPFFTTKEVGKGTGLGLATVYGIAQQHGGWVRVHSTLGTGARFEVFLPASSERATLEAKEPGTSATGHIRGGSETILVVEDESAVRGLVTTILNQYGYRTIEAASGVEALGIWEKCHSQIDLVLTDLVMPDSVSGRELGERLSRAKPGVRIIYTSGYSIDAAGPGLRLEEGMNFIQKPYHPRKLAETVRACLDHSGQSKNRA